MRTTSSLLAVVASAAGLFLACGGGLGSPSDNLLGNDPIPNSGENPGSSTDPAGSSTDPIGGGTCVCPAGRWDCGQLNLSIALKDGACVAGKTVIDLCTGKFTSDDGSGSIRPKGSGLELCIGNQCIACTPATVQTDSGLPDVGVKDSGVKDTGIVDAPKDVAKVCTSFCASNADCQNTCPAAGSGKLNCCDSVNTNTCTVVASSVCP